VTLFLLVSTYTAPRKRIEELVPEHREYLREHFAAGRFVVSGRRVPWTGGVIVARASGRVEVEALVAEDPFSRAGAAATEVIEFEPLFRAPELDGLL
jgi:uncharacterized protein YciI